MTSDTKDARLFLPVYFFMLLRLFRRLMLLLCATAPPVVRLISRVLHFQASCISASSSLAMKMLEAHFINLALRRQQRRIWAQHGARDVRISIGVERVRDCNRNVLDLLGVADTWSGYFEQAQSNLEHSSNALQKHIPYLHERIMILYRSEKYGEKPVVRENTH